MMKVTSMYFPWEIVSHFTLRVVLFGINEITAVNFYSGLSNASVTLDQHSLLLDGKVRIRLYPETR